MSGNEVSGVDLARVALRSAMDVARANGGGRKAKAKPRLTRTVRRDGREPMGLGAAIGALVTECTWELPAAGATLRERWSAIAPELAGHVAAVSYDADSGRLTVCPESSAWTTKARLEQTRVIAAANQSAGRTVVRALRILVPGTVPVTEPGDADPKLAAAPVGPPRTRERASDGYRRVLSARREVEPRRRGWTRTSRRRWSGRSPRCGRSTAGCSPSRSRGLMTGRPGSSRPASSAVVRPVHLPGPATGDHPHRPGRRARRRLDSTQPPAPRIYRCPTEGWGGMGNSTLKTGQTTESSRHGSCVASVNS
ncbi:DUF721 domain-containing protein [Streptomyces sp. LaBMicrA B280]|uniref:DUF721 domain-containing protein n=1 Tax=Streptomyces sp. LaBMicrA B280 TaxID=3391001 RepID=UPI003BA43F65